MNIAALLKTLFEPLSAIRAASDDERQRWRLDPLSHPDLDAMSMRELGDVPLRPVR